MAIVGAILNRICRVKPVNRLIKKFADITTQRDAWKSLPQSYIENAKEVITALHQKPEGHATWERKPAGSYAYDLSVIVPFYNTEQYARRCIDSIISQRTEYSFEVILVNDGSQDGCREILDSYSHHKNVKVFHKKNGGLSNARNFGILHASGEYLCFCDSDDYLDNNALDSLMHAAKTQDADIVEGGYTSFDDYGRTVAHLHDAKILTHGQEMYGYPWGKVYRSTLFGRICFPSGYWFEDTIIGGVVFSMAKKTITISQNVYFYYINKNGITHQAKTNSRSIDTYYIFEELFDAFQTVGIPISAAIQSALIWQLSTYVLNRCSGIGKDNLKSLFVLCANLARRYGILEPDYVNSRSGWPREVLESFVNMQFGRWKLASKMI